MTRSPRATSGCSMSATRATSTSGGRKSPQFPMRLKMPAWSCAAIMAETVPYIRSRPEIMEKELTDRADAIHERITQLRDSL